MQQSQKLWKRKAQFRVEIYSMIINVVVVVDLLSGLVFIGKSIKS